MIDQITAHPGIKLGLDSYRADFRVRAAHARSGIWKLERRQYFRQPEDESWRAYADGEWTRSLEVLDAEQPDIAEELGAFAADGVRVHRLRIADTPLSGYLHWELHSLLIRQRCGEDIRVAPPESVHQFEAHAPVPEVLVVGDSAVYEILYNEEGMLCGGVLHTEPGAIDGCRTAIAALHARAEPLPDYFERAVAGLSAPSGERWRE